MTNRNTQDYLAAAEADFQHYTEHGIPAERQADLRNITKRRVEKGKRILKNTAATVGVVLVAGAGVVTLKVTDGPNSPVDHPKTVQLENVGGIQGATEVIAYDNATPAQQLEARELSTGKIESDQP